MRRRDFLLSLPVAALGASACHRAVVAPESTSPPPRHAALTAALRALEGSRRLGVAVLDTGTGEVFGHRLDERFAMCSTFKVVLAAMVLEQAAAGGRGLDTVLPVTGADLVIHAPVTEPLVRAAVERGETHAALTVRELARAAQLTSDNPATNVLLRAIGGPAAFTAYCRGHGDAVTRLDRYEPEMNDVQGDDPRDTTSPRAMATLLARLLGDGLPAASRDQLWEWMVETTTGVRRLRAGLPPDWRAGDKTGTMVGPGHTAKLNDVAWVEPPGRAPQVITAYLDTRVETESVRDEDQAVLAEVGRLVARG